MEKKRNISNKTKINSPKKPEENLNIYEVDLIFEVLEIGNFPNKNEKYFLEVNFKDQRLTPLKSDIIPICVCGPVDVLEFKWSLTLKIKDEVDIINISSTPLIVECSEVNPDFEGTVEQLKSNNLKKLSWAIVDLHEIVATVLKTISKVVDFQSLERKFGSENETWTNNPFLKYRLSTTKPFLENANITYNSFSIAFECIFNLPSKWTASTNTYNVGVKLPFHKKNPQTVVCKNGRLIKSSELPRNYIYCCLSNYDHPAKCSEVHTNSDYARNSLLVSEDHDEHLPYDLLGHNKYLVAFYGFFRCVASNQTLLDMLSTKATIEVIINLPEGEQVPLMTFFDFVPLSNVGEKRVRNLLPLFEFNPDIAKMQTGQEQRVFEIQPFAKPSEHKEERTKRRNPMSGKKKQPEEAKEQTKLYSLSPIKYEGFTTGIVVEICLSLPLMTPRPEESMENLNDIPTFTIERKLPYFPDEQLEFQFAQEISNFARMIEVKNNRMNISKLDQMCIVGSKANAFGVATTMLLKRFYYSNAANKEEMQDLLDDSYIYIINKVRQAIAPQLDLSNITTRYFSALECAELGFLDEAEDLYILNIIDSKNNPEQLVKFAIHNLLIGDHQMCLECCSDVLKNDKDYNFCYLLQAYVSFVNGNLKEAERILTSLTLKCKNFLEAWFALFVIYFQLEQDANMNFALQNMMEGQDDPHTSPFHTLKTITWKSKESSDIYVNSISSLIAWGCIEFAAVGLSRIVHDYGCNHFLYCYHMALVEYYRKNYMMALQRLGNIKNEKTSQNYCKIMLRIHCLLNMESLEGIYQLHRLMKTMPRDQYDQQTNLLFLKAGKYYLVKGKCKTAKWYLKQCYSRFTTLSTLILLGEAEMKCQHWEEAESHFKTAIDLDEFQGNVWGYLAIIYFRNQLKPQCIICSKNARKRGKLNTMLSEKLKEIDES